MLDRYFELRAHGTTVRTEVLAGCTTFLTMAYIMFVNPQILADAGMDRGAVFVATCIGTAIGTLIMGLYANYPLALAPGMGLNAYFTYGVVKGMHYSWEIALGAVLISGVLFLILSVLKLREWIVDSIPQSLKMAISAGIGLFLGIIALHNAGIVVGSPDTLVTMGDMKAPSTILAVCGFLAIVALDARKVPGAIIISVLAVTAIGVGLGVSPFGGIFSAPPSLAPTFLKLDLKGALDAGLIVSSLPSSSSTCSTTPGPWSASPTAPGLSAKTARFRGSTGSLSPIRRRPSPARCSARPPSRAISKAPPGSAPAAEPAWSAWWSQFYFF